MVIYLSLFSSIYKYTFLLSIETHEKKLLLCWLNYVGVISPSEDQITQRTSISESLIVALID